MVFNKISIFFIITPKAELQEKLKYLTTNHQVIELLTTPILFEYINSAHSILSVEEHDVKLRVIFLIGMYDDYVLSNDNDEISHVISELLAPLPIKYQVFDKWWEVMRLDPPENSDEILKNVDERSLNQIALTNFETIDKWVSQIIQRKKDAK